MSWSDVHCHGWGIATADGDKFQVEKEPMPAKASEKFAAVAKSSTSRLIIGHLRKATIGQYSYENAQPFVNDNWAFAHNGNMARRHFIDKLSPYRDLIKGETDSEIYFYWLLKNAKKAGVDGLKKAVSEVRARRFTSINFLMSDGVSLYAYWEKSPTAPMPYPDYYQLYLTRRTQPDRLIICSERLDDGVWEKIPMRMLIEITSGLELKFYAV